MALINGNNASNKLFDVVDGDGDVLASFDTIREAVECGRAAPWYAGTVDIRRDITINARQHAVTMKLQADARAAMDFGSV